MSKFASGTVMSKSKDFLCGLSWNSGSHAVCVSLVPRCTGPGYKARVSPGTHYVEYVHVYSLRIMQWWSACGSGLNSLPMVLDSKSVFPDRKS